MSKSIRGYHRLLALLALSVLMALPGRLQASSIFDDDSFDEPVPRQRTKSDPKPPVKTVKPKPVQPKPEEDPKPEVAPGPAPDVPALPPEPVLPSDPAQQSLSKLIPDPKSKIKEINAQLKEIGPVKPDNDKAIHLMHLRAVCYLMLGDLPNAKVAMEPVTKSKFTNRSVVLNAARIDIATNINAPRAMIDLASYLSKNPEDEDAFTLYGSSLAANARRNKKKGLPQEKIDLYVQLLSGTESRHPGQKRWGNDWMDGGAYNEMMKKREEALKVVDEVWREYQRAADNERQVKANTRPVKMGIRYVLLPEQIARINRAEDEADAAYAKVKEARSKVPKPKWTYSMIPMTPDPKLVPEEKIAAVTKDPTAKAAAVQGVKN